MTPTDWILLSISIGVFVNWLFIMLGATQATEDAMQSRQTAHADAVEANRLLNEILLKTEAPRITFGPAPIARDHGVVKLRGGHFVREGSAAHEMAIKEGRLA